MSTYQDLYVAQQLQRFDERQLEKSLELARLRREGRINRIGFGERIRWGAGEALIAIGQKLKERSNPLDYASECG